MMSARVQLLFLFAMQCLWIFARDRHRTRAIHGTRKWTAGTGDIFTPFVLECLIQANIFPPAPDEEVLQLGPRQCEDVLERLVGGHVIGVALCRPAWSPDALKVLRPLERALKDYWDLTWELDGDLLFFDLVHSACFVRPQKVYIDASVNQHPRTLFFGITEPSSVRCLAAQIRGEGQVPGISVQTWLEQHGFFANGDGPNLRVALQMPVPHAILCTRDSWKLYCVPFLVKTAKARAIGLTRVPSLYKDVAHNSFSLRELNWDDQVVATLSPDMLQNLADMLRTLLHGGPDAIGQNLHAEAMSMVGNVQHLRDVLVRASARRTTQAFAMDLLLNALLLSGAFSDTQGLRGIISQSLHVAIPDVAARQYFQDRVATPGIVPSARALRKHRLTVAIAFFLHRQRVLQSFLDQGECVVYRTVDSSPQGGFDWVMAGCRVLSAGTIRQCYQDAMTAIRMRDVPDAQEQQHDILSKLEPILRLHQSAPVAVGSGRCSMLHKLHAVAHSERLHSPSWLATVQLLNSTWSFVGDLGTESMFTQFRGSLKELFGDWIAEDGNPEPPQPEPPEPEQDEFDFVVHEGGAAHVPPQQPQLDPWIVDLTRALFIPGVLHVAHTAVEDLATVLYQWGPFVEQLSSLTKLLSRTWSRQRLLNTCFVDEPERSSRDLYSGFDANVFEGRWGTVMHAISSILPLEVSLRYAWSVDKFMFGNGGEPRLDDQEIRTHITSTPCLFQSRRPRAGPVVVPSPKLPRPLTHVVLLHALRGRATLE